MFLSITVPLGVVSEMLIAPVKGNGNGFGESAVIGADGNRGTFRFNRFHFAPGPKPKFCIFPYPELQKGRSDLSKGEVNWASRGRALGELFLLNYFCS